MAKLSRVVQKIFGGSAPSSQLGKIGSLAAGSPVTTSDPTVMQSLSNYLNGWYDVIMGDNSPAIEDMNSLHFLITRQLSYIFQAGVSEWQTDTEYHIGSLVNDGAGNLYSSKTNTNSGNALSDKDEWVLILGSGLVGKNYLVNPECEFMQHLDGTSFTKTGVADGDFAFDQWMMQTDAPAAQILASHSTRSAPESPDLAFTNYGKIANETGATNYYGGLVNMLDQDTSQKLAGKTINFRCHIQSESSGTQYKIAIIEWRPTSWTVNAYPRSVVNTWSATPTLNTDFNILAMSDAFTTTTTGYFPDGTNVVELSGASHNQAKNIGVFVFSSSTLGGSFNDGFKISGCSLEVGATASPYDKLVKTSAEVLKDCQGFYSKSYSPQIIPGAVTATGSESHTVAGTAAALATDSQLRFPQPFALQQNSPPASITFYSESGSSGSWSLINPGGSNGSVTCSAVHTNYLGCNISPSAATVTLTTSKSYEVYGHWVADGRMGT